MNGSQFHISFSVLWLAFGLAACSQQDQVSFNSGGLTHNFASGKDASGAGFPLPLYPNSQPQGSKSAAGPEEQDNFMMLTSVDGVDKISEFYNSTLKNSGWQVDSKKLTAELVNLSAVKGQLEASVMISGDGKSTSITLTYAKVPEGTPKVSDEPFVPDKLNPPTD